MAEKKYSRVAKNKNQAIVTFQIHKILYKIHIYTYIYTPLFFGAYSIFHADDISI
jgi:hypothetical protein